MVQLNTIQQIVRIVKSKLDAHKEFRNAYNKQLAFNFSLFNFFKFGENKLSEILAFFLNPNESHGQGSIFLREFVTQFISEETDISNPLIICEKVITKKRRIDLYIELKSFIVAIENKIWADDQVNQLKDYATYLKKNTKGNFMLLYLNPYGTLPSKKSISEALINSLVAKNQYKIISYSDDIMILLDKWLIVCEAESVSYFIKELKKYLSTKFHGNNTLNMSKNLREIIYANQEEVKSIIIEYKAIENEIIRKLNSVGKLLETKSTEINSNLTIKRSKLFNWKGLRICQHSISKDENKIWIQFCQNGINLYSNYYFQDGTDAIFKEIVTKSSLNKNIIIDYTKSKNELADIFLEQVNKVNQLFNEYDEYMQDDSK